MGHISPAVSIHNALKVYDVCNAQNAANNDCASKAQHVWKQLAEEGLLGSLNAQDVTLFTTREDGWVCASSPISPDGLGTGL